MHIILVSSRLATARTLYITPGLIVAAVLGFITFSFATSFLFSWMGARFNLPFIADLVESVQRVHHRKTDEFVRDNVSTMAVRLGEMQAQLVRLDNLGERVAKQSGISLPKAEVTGVPMATVKGGGGGPLVNPGRPFSFEELGRAVDRLSVSLDARTEDLTALESQMMERRIKTTLLPSLVPINADHIGSTFGSRIDPIAGVGAMHSGIDFVADSGTRVQASAGGVVAVAEYHPQYGNMIEIDHSNEFTSVYAHLSRFGVKAGQIVKRGQEIARSGNTGRSTGPHLHFEVRYRGVAQNPARFLQAGEQLAFSSAPTLSPRKNGGSVRIR